MDRMSQFLQSSAQSLGRKRPSIMVLGAILGTAVTGAICVASYTYRTVTQNNGIGLENKQAQLSDIIWPENQPFKIQVMQNRGEHAFPLIPPPQGTTTTVRIGTSQKLLEEE